VLLLIDYLDWETQGLAFQKEELMLRRRFLKRNGLGKKVVKILDGKKDP